MTTQQFNDKYKAFLEEGHYGLDLGKPEAVTYLDAIINIKDELDELYDELTYDNDEKEIASIKTKIATREDILKKLLSE
jgi:hypothetical protein